VVEDRGGQLSGSYQIPHSSFLIISDTTDFFVCGKPHRGIPIQAGASAAQPLQSDNPFLSPDGTPHLFILSLWQEPIASPHPIRDRYLSRCPPPI
jgi:hypothetical protein